MSASAQSRVRRLALAMTVVAAASLVAGLWVIAARSGWRIGADPDATKRLALTTLLGAALAIQALFLGRRRDDAPATTRALWGAPVLCLLAASVAYSALVALFVPIALGGLLVGLAWRSAAAAEDRCVRATRGLPVPEPATRARGRTVAACSFAVPVLGLAALLLPVATCSPLAFLGGRSGRAAHADTDLGGSGGGRGGRVRVDPSGVGSDDAELGREVLLVAVPMRGDERLGDQGPFYLRGLVMDGADDDGVWTPSDVPGQRIADGDDGADDGWCTLGPRPDPSTALELEVRQVAVSAGRSGRSLLHVPPKPARVSADACEHAPDGALTVADDGASVVRYAVLAPHPSRVPSPSPGAKATPRDAASLALARRRPVVAALAAEARDATLGLATDAERVAAVVRHLRETFAYVNVGGGESGFDGLERFLTARRGSCVQFAEAAAWMLRSQRIPARVATGFLVREWDPARRSYVARGGDYHAWVEVEFDGCGWTIQDATPVAAEPRAPTDAAADDAQAGGTSPLDAVERRLREFVAAAIRAARERPEWWALSALLTTVAAVVVSLARDRGPRGAAAATDRDDRTPWGRLLREIERRGHVRRPSQTAVEFAEAVAAAEGAEFEPFVELTWRRQAARFGGRELTAGDVVAIDGFRSALARQPNRL